MMHKTIKFISGTVPRQDSKRDISTTGVIQFPVVSEHDRVHLSDRIHEGFGWQYLRVLTELTIQATERIPSLSSFARGGEIGDTTRAYTQELQRLRQNLEKSGTYSIVHICFMTWKLYCAGKHTASYPYVDLTGIESNTFRKRAILDQRAALQVTLNSTRMKSVGAKHIYKILYFQIYLPAVKDAFNMWRQWEHNRRRMLSKFFHRWNLHSSSLKLKKLNAKRFLVVINRPLRKYTIYGYYKLAWKLWTEYRAPKMSVVSSA